MVKVAAKLVKLCFMAIGYTPQFLEKLESWLVRLNTPLNTCRPMYTYTQKFVSNPLLGSSVVQLVNPSILMPKHRKFSQVPTADTVLSNLLSFTPGMDSGMYMYM